MKLLLSQPECEFFYDYIKYLVSQIHLKEQANKVKNGERNIQSTLMTGDFQQREMRSRRDVILVNACNAPTQENTLVNEYTLDETKCLNKLSKILNNFDSSNLILLDLNDELTERRKISFLDVKIITLHFILELLQ